MHLVCESSKHFVMRRPGVVVEHDVLHLFRHHGDLRISPSKLLNGCNRLPVRHDQKLNTTLYLAPQDRGTDKARDLREFREGLEAYMLDVIIRVQRLGNSAPMA